MGYGFTYEEMRDVKKPASLNRAWGSFMRIVDTAYYCLDRFHVRKGGVQPLHFYTEREGTLYVEDGSVFLRLVGKDGKKCSLKINKGECVSIMPGMVHGAIGLDDSDMYFFSGHFDDLDYILVEAEDEPLNASAIMAAFGRPSGIAPSKTGDFRDKYWGSIESIVSKDYCGKRICMKKGTQNSLEVHCNKHETYYVHNGTVDIGIRVGRGENHIIRLTKGDVFLIPQGLMHMKIAPADSVVIEISTKDDDSDSHLVEDGQKYVHVVAK